MTFLEYVAERLMGPPASRSSGRSTWLCPFHDESNPSFCTLPPKAGCKDRFRCFGCGAWGDEYDLMKLFYDRENFSERRDRMEQWREDWKRDQPLFHRGPGRVKVAEQVAGPGNDPRDVDIVWAGLTMDLEAEDISQAVALRVLSEAADHCKRNNVSLEALLKYWQRFEEWIAETGRQHLAECTDPNCDAIVCRARRGLPPLTKAEIAARGGRCNAARR
ncbi:MAG: CHC2 zinc finger domain-containing protein [Thermoguttaceae bacterium]